MKRWIAIVLTLVLCLSVTGCGGSGPSGILKLCVDGPAFGETSTMSASFPEEMAAVRLGSWFTLPSLTRPVVNKGTESIALLDADFTAAFADAKEFDGLLAPYNHDSGSYTERMARGTLVMTGSDPVLCGGAIGQQLMREEVRGELAYLAIPNELGGVTAEITAYAFAPATASDQEAVQVFLSWLLSEQSQNGSIPIFSGLGGGYPVRKGCAGALFDNNQSNTGSLEYIGEGYLTRLSEMENRVSNGTFTTAYELMNLLSAWHAGVITDLDAALEELYGDWALYLDE